MIYLNNYFRLLMYFLLPCKQYAKFVGVCFGKGCVLSTKYWSSEPFLIVIGEYVHVTRGVRFITHDGGGWVFRRSDPTFDVFGKISIGDNTYIGNDSVILPGITIGCNCVIGANSIVTKSIPDNSVVAGNPARFISNTNDYYNRISLYNSGLKLEKNKKRKILLLNDKKFIKKAMLKNE